MGARLKYGPAGLAYTGGVDHPGFEEVDHTADWALRLQGKDLDELLTNAARGLFRLTGVKPRPGARPGRWRTLKLAAADREALLVAWLGELAFEMESRGVAYTDLEVRSQGGTRLTARLREVPAVSGGRFIKAVTYHDLRIESTPAGLTATVVFDV
jgi:SHS2 domain-containing protein